MSTIGGVLGVLGLILFLVLVTGVTFLDDDMDVTDYQFYDEEE